MIGNAWTDGGGFTESGLVQSSSRSLARTGIITRTDQQRKTTCTSATVVYKLLNDLTVASSDLFILMLSSAQP